MIKNRKSDKRLAAYAVHLYTASGIFWVLLAVRELFAQTIDPKMVFLWLAAAVVVDATDGPLARKCSVKTYAPAVSGRTIDDIVDYLSFSFVPLLLVWRMDWLPFGLDYAWLLIVPALIASLFGFANCKAKDEDGFFLGFPSYWNIYAFYAGIFHFMVGSWLPAVILFLFTILTLVPIRFLYPNLAPKPWRRSLLIGAALWLLVLLLMLPAYPNSPFWLLVLSFVYPGYYCILSRVLDTRIRLGKL